MAWVLYTVLCPFNPYGHPDFRGLGGTLVQSTSGIHSQVFLQGCYLFQCCVLMTSRAAFIHNLHQVSRLQ